MPRDPHESLDDYQRRRRETQSVGARIFSLVLVLIVVGSAGLGIIRGGWVRICLFGVVPALVVLLICGRLYRVRPLRVVVAPIGALILIAFPALWTDSVAYALTRSWTWSTGLAIIVLLAELPLLVAANRWAVRRKKERDRSRADAPTE